MTRPRVLYDRPEQLMVLELGAFDPKATYSAAAEDMGSGSRPVAVALAERCTDVLNETMRCASDRQVRTVRVRSDYVTAVRSPDGKGD